MESLRAVVQGEFDTSPRLSLRWKTLADAPNPVAHIRTWGRSGGLRRSWLPVCYRTGRHRATQTYRTTNLMTKPAQDGTGRHRAGNGTPNLHAGGRGFKSRRLHQGGWRGASGRLN